MRRENCSAVNSNTGDYGNQSDNDIDGVEAKSIRCVLTRTDDNGIVNDGGGIGDNEDDDNLSGIGDTDIGNDSSVGLAHNLVGVRVDITSSTSS